jgi:hypothetical protein
MEIADRKLKSPVENQRKITFFLGQTDESNQDSTEDIGTTGNSDNTSDTPVELWKFQDRLAKFASTIPTTGARYANSMGRRSTFCTISALKENLHAP